MSQFRFAQPDLPRKVGLAAGAAVVAGLVLVALLGLSAADNRRASIAEKQAIIARADALGPAAATGLSEDAFFPGETPQLAQAAMQTDLQDLSDGHDISIDMIRADEIEQIDGLVRLNLTLNGVAPEAELGAFLHGLAEMNPIVVVEDLSLRPARVSRTNPERRVAFQASLYGIQKP